MKKRTWILILLSVLLVMALVVTGVLYALLRPPVVYRFGATEVRQSTYDYWVACYKYAYLVSMKQYGIEDTAEGWAKTDEQGQSYDAIFCANIENAIKRRLVAAELFDKAGLGLGSEVYSAIRLTIDNMGYYEDEQPLKELKKVYGVNRRAVHQVAVFEAKYDAYREYLFGSDGKGVYEEDYRSLLTAYYEQSCLRFRLIYIPNDSYADQATVEKAIENGIMTEELFQTYAEQYNNLTTITENYPNGIYYCRNVSGALNDFDDNVADAVGKLDSVGKALAVENEAKTGKFYLMRCALATEGFLTEDIPGFAQVAAEMLYPTYLSQKMQEVTLEKGTPLAGMTAVTACRDYNIVKIWNDNK